MQYRELGRTGLKVSALSFGSWAIGGTWGTVDDRESLAALNRAVELGVDLFDTADVYGGGRSERLLAKLRQQRREQIFIATKIGRGIYPHVARGYNRPNLTASVERCLRNLSTQTIDLLQLHCPPSEVFDMPEVFDIMDDLVKAGKVRSYGVSVEKIEEAQKAIRYPNVQTVQMIFNMFRQRPSEQFFAQAQERNIGILARVPLASGMLTGKFKPDTRFESDDHRAFNRAGEAFDRGETFSGVDYKVGLQAVEELRTICPPGLSMAQFALRWILMFDAVSCAIPGAKRPSQVDENFSAADLPPLSPEIMDQVRSIYDRRIRGLVHQYW
jgi:aryl-alcohol dehydrogenase-like predicted oxidoreductase